MPYFEQLAPIENSPVATRKLLVEGNYGRNYRLFSTKRNSIAYNSVVHMGLKKEGVLKV